MGSVLQGEFKSDGVEVRHTEELLEIAHNTTGPISLEAGQWSNCDKGVGYRQHLPLSVGYCPFDVVSSTVSKREETRVSIRGHIFMGNDGV